jgi:hypothetical protein
MSEEGEGEGEVKREKVGGRMNKVGERMNKERGEKEEKEKERVREKGE